MKGKIKIDTELCKGCMYCIDTCQAGVIVIRKRFNKNGFFPAIAKHLEKCSGCAMCAKMCPEIAIEVYRTDAKETKKTRK